MRIPLSLPSQVYYLLFFIYYLSYEKRRLEDCDSADCVDPDGGTDGTGHNELHGPRPAVCVERERKTVEKRVLEADIQVFKQTHRRGFSL